ncbi:MAG: FAD-dependent thymidylate synthase [bacterium]
MPKNKIITNPMAKIFIHDELQAEDNAMLQALYSRSAKSVEEHMEKVKATGSGKFMETFYVGYGHNSIADCGSTTLFIEGLSIIADKAIQDWPLYSGQETSTRYVDMAKQPIIDPIGRTDTMQIMINWMNFYNRAEEPLKDHLRKLYPRRAEEKEEQYEKAIATRGFDIRRAFLPAGITTQLSWHTNLRQAHDKLDLLRHWPVSEIQEIAEKMLRLLKVKYKHSFNHEIWPDQEAYRKEIMTKHAFYAPTQATNFAFHTNIKQSELYQYKEEIVNRPIKTNLPLFLGELGNCRFDFLLDYGSFRDIQRHRNGTCRIPLLNTGLGFNAWYLEQLPINLLQEALELIADQKQLIDDLDITPELRQYYVALGFNVQCRVAYNLPATIYVVELRSGRLVHPTLRKVAHLMHASLKAEFPELTLHSDLDPSDWDVRRGEQDIVERK